MEQYTIARYIINRIKEINAVSPSIESQLSILIYKNQVYEIIKNNAGGIINIWYQYMGGMILLEFH